MCGRFTLRTPMRTIVEQFDARGDVQLALRFNIAPTQLIPVVHQRKDQPHRQIELMTWGLIPSWAADPRIGSRMINARSETAAVKPSFRAAFRRRRCLIPADGYFEWKKTGARTKQPYYFHRNDDRPFAMAGLWEHWDGGDGPVLSCTILTTDANDLARTVHDRMPVILEPADYADWLNPQLQEKDDLQPLLCPYAGPLEAYPVRTLVNSPRNDLPECIEPIELPPGEFSPQDAP